MPNFNINEITDKLITKYMDANIEYEITCKNNPVELNGMIQPLLRSNALSQEEPWLISSHYNVDAYEDDIIYYTYCKNYMIQREALTKQLKISYWLYFIIKSQQMFFDNNIDKKIILNYFPPFQEKNGYIQFVELLKDIYGIECVKEMITDYSQIKNIFLQFMEAIFSVRSRLNDYSSFNFDIY
jgi:hypothetical protein